MVQCGVLRGKEVEGHVDGTRSCGVDEKYLVCAHVVMAL
jgi:hypothetical protein